MKLIKESKFFPIYLPKIVLALLPELQVFFIKPKCSGKTAVTKSLEIRIYITKCAAACCHHGQFMIL